MTPEQEAQIAEETKKLKEALDNEVNELIILVTTP